MKRILPLLLAAALVLCPVFSRAELTDFTPEMTMLNPTPPAELTKTEEGRAELAALLLLDCLGGDALPSEDALPDYRDLRLLVRISEKDDELSNSQVGLLCSAGEQVFAIFLGLGAGNAGWDVVKTGLTDSLVERLCQSLGFTPWTVDPEAVRVFMNSAE